MKEGYNFILMETTRRKNWNGKRSIVLEEVGSIRRKYVRSGGEARFEIPEQG